MQQNKNAFLFISHNHNDFMVHQFMHLKKSAEKYGDIFWCIPFEYIKNNGNKYFGFDNDILLKTWQNYFYFKINYIIESFYLKNKDKYDFYYVLEYDVYAKNWDEILNKINNKKYNDVDFISTNIYEVNKDSDWMWNELFRKKHIYEKNVLAAPLCFSRLSKQFLHIITEERENKCDLLTDDVMFELSFPTIARDNNLKLMALSKYASKEYFSDLDMCTIEDFHTVFTYFTTNVFFENNIIYHAYKEHLDLPNNNVKYFSFLYDKNNEKCHIIKNFIIDNFNFFFVKKENDDIKQNIEKNELIDLFNKNEKLFVYSIKK